MSGLLLGASGQVGHELHKALAIHLDLHAPDRRTLDLTDLDAVKRCLDHYRPQWVINAAAYTAVDQAETGQRRGGQGERHRREARHALRERGEPTVLSTPTDRTRRERCANLLRLRSCSCRPGARAGAACR